MYKAVGFLCILAGCAGWGHSLAGQEKERVRHLRVLSQMLGQMRSEISYGKHTMPEICLLLKELNDECYSECFGRIYKRTAGEGGTDFPRVWEEELGKCMEPFPLREDEKRTVAELAKSLRFREEGGQAGRVGQAEAFLEGRYRQAEETCENKSKMIHSVSILTGLLLAILLL
ncbi:MAG: stage III sporulation protein AB [Lachnospiraceae bacterium]|nr:stage III sporulation protein AB [Lachnospiraceae bacterium]MDE6602988.1 stage III sporulation protein AB [Lachnospiraceae bacterium]